MRPLPFYEEFPTAEVAGAQVIYALLSHAQPEYIAKTVENSESFIMFYGLGSEVDIGRCGKDVIFIF